MSVLLVSLAFLADDELATNDSELALAIEELSASDCFLLDSDSELAILSESSLDSDLEAAILSDSFLLLDRALSDDSFSLIELALLMLAFLFDASFAELFFALLLEAVSDCDALDLAVPEGAAQTVNAKNRIASPTEIKVYFLYGRLTPVFVK